MSKNLSLSRNFFLQLHVWIWANVSPFVRVCVSIRLNEWEWMSAIIKMADINVLRTMPELTAPVVTPHLLLPAASDVESATWRSSGLEVEQVRTPWSPRSFVYGCRTFPTSGLCIPPAAGLKLNSSLQTDSQFTSLSCTGKNKPCAGPTPLFPCTSIKADPVYVFLFFTTAAMSLSSWSAVTASPAGLFLPSEWGVKKKKYIFLFKYMHGPHSKWHSKCFPMQNKQRFITTALREDRRAASLSWSSVLMWAFPCFWKHLRGEIDLEILSQLRLKHPEATTRWWSPVTGGCRATEVVLFFHRECTACTQQPSTHWAVDSHKICFNDIVIIKNQCITAEEMSNKN